MTARTRALVGAVLALGATVWLALSGTSLIDTAGSSSSGRVTRATRPSLEIPVPAAAVVSSDVAPRAGADTTAARAPARRPTRDPESATEHASVPWEIPPPVWDGASGLDEADPKLTP
jgi:hypothetical protein